MGSLIKNSFVRTALAMMILVWSGSLLAASKNVLKDLTVNSLPGERVQIRLKMAKPAQKPVSFTINNPARIAIDFLNTKNGLRKRNRRIGVGLAQSVNTIEARGRTRLVINLSKLVGYKTRIKGKNVYITLNSGGGPSVARITRARPRVSSHGNQRIETIDFRRGTAGSGRIVVNLRNPSASVDIRKVGNKIVADFLNTRLPKNLERRLDVVDFATPVKNIDTFRHGNHVRMIVAPSSDYQHMAYQSDNVYTIEVKPVKKVATKSSTGVKSRYRGEKLTLNFQNIKVRAVLQLLADFTKKNIVVSDSVKGSLTLRLKNVPWDQALDIILKSKGLAMRSEGNVIRVAPAEEMAQIEQAELAAYQKTQQLAPVRTEWFQINYANAKDILKTVSNKKASLLSKRGKAVIDQRTNTLMVQDTSDRLNDIRNLIKRLDIPVRQVLIESRIVIANKDFSKDLGVKFGISNSNPFNGGRDFVTLGGKNRGDTSFPQTTGFENPAGSGNESLMVDMGVDPGKTKAGRFGLAVGRLGTAVLQLELSALQAEGKGEIVSSPRLITANQKQAFIEQGIEIPYAEAASSGAASIAFKKAVLSLKVTPQITPDDRIIMDLEVKKDSADLKNTIGASQNVAINTREINTQVLVNNGETIVLGGIYEAQKDKKVNRVPFLGKIPLLGVLFRDKAVIDNRSELLIFVTPKIIKDDFNKTVK
jgi:type IV pilus assembly protein PilQ